jgi:hypothetical protein
MRILNNFSKPKIRNFDGRILLFARIQNLLCVCVCVCVCVYAHMSCADTEILHCYFDVDIVSFML